MGLLQEFYATTLEALKDGKNDRLWFKTSTKHGKLHLEQEEHGKLQKILQQLHQSFQTHDREDDLKKRYPVIRSLCFGDSNIHGTEEQ